MGNFPFFRGSLKSTDNAPPLRVAPGLHSRGFFIQATAPELVSRSQFFTVGDMPTVAKKPAVRRRAGSAKKPAAAPRARLTPPPGLSAAEFLKRLPPPAKDFDAEGVERIVALRASR